MNLRKLQKPLYDYNIGILKDFGYSYKYIVCRALRNSNLDFDSLHYEPKGSVNSEKLDNNISRARNKVLEYALSNKWDYFVTLTINSDKYDRTNLELYYNDFSKFLRNLKNYNKIDVKYLLIPELHSDKKSWHLHGLIKGLPPEELSKNKNQYLDWQRYREKFGYISLGNIISNERVASYITKYITKHLSDRIKDLNAHLYYCSKGLKVARVIKKGTSALLTDPPNYENDFVKIYNIPKVVSEKDLINSLFFQP